MSHDHDAIDPQLWRAADDVLARLLNLDESERPRALARLALAPVLHACVLRLLDAHRGTRGILDTPVSAHAETPDALRGRSVGRWRLEHEIGRGGMAVVYRARSTDGAEQQAAVKLLTLAAQASRGSDLFRHEQAMLAQLRHPHIASLYEAGVADDGTPWLAMALIEGTRIDVWCDEQLLAPRPIVELFMDVCAAVAYAHRNLIIHRDIKPSNVMVDHDGHVRLLDFGIARLLDRTEGETLTQWRALTPDYAAPEQFHGAAPSTAMDVYGLGALLYRLLSGGAPQSSTSDGHIVAPGQRAKAGMATQLGDLDAIVLKALATDPAQRYETVPALAEDLRRWLQGLPVRARTPTLGYRLSRFVRRHRGQVLTAGLVTLSLLVALAISIWQAQRAQDAAIEAQRQANRAGQELQRADAMRDFMTRLFVATDPERPSEQITTTAQLLDAGVRLAGEMNDNDALLRADIETTIGRIHVLQGGPAKALPLLEDAIARARAAGDQGAIVLARALMWRGLIPDDRQSTPIEESYFSQASSLLETHAPQNPLRVEVRRNWAWGAQVNRHYAEVEPLLKPILDGHWNGPAPTSEQRLKLLDLLALGYTSMGRIGEAKPVFDAELSMHRSRHSSDTRPYAIALVNSSGADTRLGHFDEADAKLTEAIALYDAMGSSAAQYRAAAYTQLGILREAQGQFDAALAARDRSSSEWAQLRKQAFEQYPYTHRARGLVAAAALRDADVIKELRQFFDLARAQHRDVSGELARGLVLLAGAECATGQVDKARVSLAGARAAAGTSYDVAIIPQLVAETELRCALAGAEEYALASSVDTLSGIDHALLPGEAGLFAWHTLLRIQALRRLGRDKEADQLLPVAIQRLTAVHLEQHPLMGRLRELGKSH